MKGEYMEVAMWKRLNEKTGEWEHNHMEIGFHNGKIPVGKYENQNQAWKTGTWKPIHRII